MAAGTSDYPTSLDTTTNLPAASTLATAELDGDGNANVQHSNLHGVADTALVQLETKLGTGTGAPTAAGKLLRATSASASGWSTLTFPDTAAISTIIYASAADVLAALATANSGVLVTSGTGVPSISSTLPAITVNGVLTLAGNVTRAADQTIDLTGAATRTLTLQNSTASQVANLDIDGNLVWRDGHATGTFTFAGTPTAARTITWQNASYTVVGRDTTDTLTNKTLTSPTIGTSPTAAGATWTDLGIVTTVDINGGTLDGAVIGGASAAAATVTTLVVNTSANPDADDGAVLGASGTAWSDLFLASGAVINFAAGDVTLTHALNLLTMAGGQFVTQVATAQGIHIDQTGGDGSTTIFDLYRRQSDAQRFGQIEYSKATVGADHYMRFFVNDTEWFRIMGAGLVAINDTANANMTAGLTINQGAADNEILALKSSDIAHGMTTLTETDTFAAIQKRVATGGGFMLSGFNTDASTVAAFDLFAYCGSENTAKTTAGLAYTQISAYLKSGTGTTNVSADANIVVFRTRAGGNDTTRFIFDTEGSAHADVEWVAFDAYDDLALVRDIEQHLLDRESAAGTYNRHALEAAGIIGRDSWHFEDGKPRAMVNMTKLAMLHHGALIQIGQRFDERDGEIAALRTEIAELRRALPTGR